MPLRDYSAKAAYDADYSIRYRTPAPMLLPAASVRFIGKSLTPAPGWPQVKHGGELRLSLGPDNPHSIIGRVADVTGDTITLMMPDERSWADSTELVAAGRARYAIPE